MKSEREFLLNELREHTLDSDCAKSQHFYEEQRYRFRSDIFNILKSVVFLATISTYILIVSEVQQGTFFNNICIVLTLVSTLFEILSYMLRYEDKAMEHWKAAQMYSELYRKCQFFCSMYGNYSLDIWREKLKDISEELSRIENNCTQFLKNIREGKCYYKSPEVRRSITDYDIMPGNYDVMIEYFKNHAENHKNDYRVFVSDVFYMYYHALAALLSSQNISWYGEKSLIAECERLSMDENKILELEMSRADFIDLMRHVRLFCKEKNRAYLLNENSEDIDRLIRYFNMDIGRVQKIKRFYGEIQNLS